MNMLFRLWEREGDNQRYILTTSIFFKLIIEEGIFIYHIYSLHELERNKLIKKHFFIHGMVQIILVSSISMNPLLKSKPNNHYIIKDKVVTCTVIKASSFPKLRSRVCISFCIDFEKKNCV